MVHAKTVLKLPPELGKRLKVEAALRGTTMLELAYAWIDMHLSLQPKNGPSMGEQLMPKLHAIPKRLTKPRKPRA